MKRIDYFWPRVAFQITGAAFVTQLILLPIGDWTESRAWALAGSGIAFSAATVWASWVVYRNAKEASNG